MTAAGPKHHDASAERNSRLDRIWANPSGWGAFSVVNHTTIGLRFIITGFVFFLIGGVLAMLIRSQLAFPGNNLLDHQAYAQAFTMHGTTMMFLFAVPIMEGFAVLLLPKMLGARDLIFPKLSAFGYWCYLFGGLLLYSSFLFSAVPDTGWFMYVPLSGKIFSPGSSVDFWLLGVTFAEISAVSAAVELIVSILKTRAPGMAIHKMPVYGWYMLVTAFMILFGFPPLILGSILLEIERAFGLPFYDAAHGGDPLLWQHLFWIFGHPEVYIIFLPAAGIVSTILPTFAQRPLAGYNWVVMAVIGTGFLSFGLWVHHMFTVGIPLLSLAFFSAASMAVAIPTGIQVFAWIATLWQGRTRMQTPMLFILGFLFIFVLGGLTGVMVAMVPFDWQVHDTHFVVAHMHYVLFGGMVFPMFAAFYYWLPLFSGRSSSDRMSRFVFWAIFLGFNLTFLPMHVTGLLGMPRRVYTYLPGLGWDTLNLISTVGGFLSAAGIGMFVLDIGLHYFYGQRGQRNLWNAGTLEWAISTPVPPYNFVSIPAVSERDPLWHNPELAEQAEQGNHYLGHADVTQRETMISSTVGGVPEYVAVLPGNTLTPLVAAVFTSIFFIGFLAKLYWLAIIGAVLTLAALLFWAWQGGTRHDPVSMVVGHGKHLPLHYSSLHAPGWLGTRLALMADATLFGSLIFAYFFLWTVSPQWPPVDSGDAGLLLPTTALATLLLSSVLIRWGEAGNRDDNAYRLRLGYLAATILAVGFMLLQITALHLSDISAKTHAYGALVYTISGVQLVHVFIAMLMSGFVILRSRSGYISRLRPVEPRVVALFWHYSTLQWLLGFAVIHLLPYAAAT